MPSAATSSSSSRTSLEAAAAPARAHQRASLTDLLSTAYGYAGLRPPPALTLPPRSDDAGAAGGRPSCDADALRHASWSSLTAPLSGSNEHSFAHAAPTPITGLHTSLDEEQRRCVNVAYHITFHGNPRVKLKPTAVELPNGAHFLIVDRFVSGNSDGVYEKNKKMWEQIPVGQARVFAHVPAATAALQVDGLAEDTAAGSEGRTPEDAPISAPDGVDRAPFQGRNAPLKASCASPPRTPTMAAWPGGGAVGGAGAAHSRTASQLGGGGGGGTPATSPLAPSAPHAPHHDWTRVATTAGLRKMGHWREATGVFSVHRAVAKSAIALEKVDGEPGHIAAFTWMGERYWVVGCRYQHIVTRLEVPETDLMRYCATAAGGGGSGSATSSSASSSSVSAPSASATPTAKTASAKRPSAAGRHPTTPSPSASPPPLPHDSAELGSVHSSSVPAGGGGAASSEAAYLDLAVRMARLWRRLLDSLQAAESGGDGAEGGSEAPDGAAAEPDVRAALHACVAADRRTLCFDAILSGWERLRSPSAPHGAPVGEPASAFSTPVSCTSTHVGRSNSNACVPSSASLASTSPVLAAIPNLALPAMPLWFYAITFDSSLEARGWCMGVEEAFAFFARLHLPTVAASAAVPLGSPAYEALRQSVLSRCDTAGAVLYGSTVSCDDDVDGGDTRGASASAVVQVWKCRAYPHSLERTVQEYVVTHRLCGEPLRNKVKKKVSSLARETRLCIKQWELHRLPFLLDFALWLHREKFITPSTDLVALKVIRGHWLSYQERFESTRLTHQHRNSNSTRVAANGVTRVPARGRRGASMEGGERQQNKTQEGGRDAGRMAGEVPSEVEREDEEEEAVEDDEGDAVDGVDAVMLVGPQGCGKSTMARVLYCLLEDAGAAPRWLNQDEVGSRAAYLAAIRRAVAEGCHSHLLLDKMNLDDKSRTDYAAVGLQPVLVVAWTHSRGAEAMADTCYERVVQRGACHRTFFAEEAPSAAAMLRPAAEASSSFSRSPELRPAASPLLDGGLGSLSGTVSTANHSPASFGPGGGSPASPSFPQERGSPPATRLHGILQASVRRYQVPSNVPLVELDVTWPCEQMIAVVWEALRDKGTCVLPPVSELHVGVALQTAHAYEQLLETYPTRVTAAVLRGPASDVVLGLLGPLVPPFVIPKTLRLQAQLEVALQDFHQHPSPTALVRFARQVGRVRRVAVQAVVSNSKVVLLLLLGPSEHAVAADVAALSDEQGAASVGGGSQEPERVPAADTASPGGAALDLEPVEAPAVQEHFAVLAKAKKVTQEYCEAMAQRVRDDPDEDPYCVVRWLSPPLELDLAVTLLHP